MFPFLKWMFKGRRRCANIAAATLLAVLTSGCWLSQSVLTEQITDSGDDSTDTVTDGLTDPAPEGHWEWQVMDTPTEHQLTGVWGRSDTDVYVVGKSATILHFDGDTWSLMEFPTNTPAGSLGDVTGSPEGDEVFAVGTDGLFIAFDGDAWFQPPEDTGTTENLHGICRISANEMYAVGDEGTFIKFDGYFWDHINSGTDRNLLSVWCRPGSDVWAVGHLNYSGMSTTVLRYTGVVQLINHPVGHFMYVVAGFGSLVRIAGMYEESQEDGPYFSLYTWGAGGWEKSASDEAFVLGMFIADNTDLTTWLVGFREDNLGGIKHPIIYRYPSTVLDEDPLSIEYTDETEITLRAVWADDSHDKGRVFAVGDVGTIVVGNYVMDY